MAGLKGRSGTNRNKEKPFAEALRMEIAKAGTDHKRLRAIAAVLLDKAEAGDIQAIVQIADRLDGKPAQDMTVTTVKRDATEYSREELAEILERTNAANGSGGIASEDGRDREPDSVH